MSAVSPLASSSATELSLVRTESQDPCCVALWQLRDSIIDDGPDLVAASRERVIASTLEKDGSSTMVVAKRILPDLENPAARWGTQPFDAVHTHEVCTTIAYQTEEGCDNGKEQQEALMGGALEQVDPRFQNHSLYRFVSNGGALAPIYEQRGWCCLELRFWTPKTCQEALIQKLTDLRKYAVEAELTPGTVLVREGGEDLSPTVLYKTFFLNEESLQREWQQLSEDDKAQVLFRSIAASATQVNLRAWEAAQPESAIRSIGDRVATWVTRKFSSNSADS